MRIAINRTIYAKIILQRVIALSYGSKSIVPKKLLIKFANLKSLAEYEFKYGYLNGYSLSIDSDKQHKINNLKHSNY